MNMRSVLCTLKTEIFFESAHYLSNTSFFHRFFFFCVCQGVLSATPLIFIIPSACFLKLSSGRWFQMKNLMPTLIFIAGVFVIVVGLIMIGLSTQDCSHAVEMFYCTDLNSSASLTMTPVSSVLPIINSTQNISIF